VQLRSQEPRYQNAGGLLIAGAGVGIIGCLATKWYVMKKNKQAAAHEAANDLPKGWRYVEWAPTGPSEIWLWLLLLHALMRHTIIFGSGVMGRFVLRATVVSVLFGSSASIGYKKRVMDPMAALSLNAMLSRAIIYANLNVIAQSACPRRSIWWSGSNDLRICNVDHMCMLSESLTHDSHITSPTSSPNLHPTSPLSAVQLC
jgi:hypothetical protein